MILKRYFVAIKKYGFIKSINIFATKYLVNSKIYKIIKKMICFIIYSVTDYAFSLFDYIRYFYLRLFKKHIQFKNAPLISIIVPCYNHSKYLNRRLRTIKNQLYRNIEIILLDDCSSDNSQKKLLKFYKNNAKICKYIFNNLNSGNVFKQWKKGIEFCKGDYIWIAESDDYCSPLFLYELLKNYNKSNLIIFGHTSFVNSVGIFFNNMSEYLRDTKFNFSKSFDCGVDDILNNGFAWKNIIVNVSSCLFKNVPNIGTTLNELDLAKMRLCGDWYFYLNLMKHNDSYNIVYKNRARNFYRVHKNSTSLDVQKSNKYVHELIYIFDYLVNQFKISSTCQINLIYYIKKEENYLDQHNSNIEITRINNETVNDIKILIVVYSFISGGGETFPIYLANQLLKDGYFVSMLNYLPDIENEKIRSLVDKRIPIIDLKNRDLNFIANKMGFNIVQTQHAGCDFKIAKIKSNNIKQIVVNHGMYENNFGNKSKKDINRIDKFIYVADKGDISSISKEKKAKIINGLPDYVPSKINRKNLNIPENAFVLCTVSRGIPEKGWVETIKAVQIARLKTNKDIHYVIVGSGPMYNKLINKVPNYIHLVGFSNNPRSYIVASDLVVLSSTFKGESSPLLIIDSFQCGKPIICTDIGDARKMIIDDDGLAGGEMLKITDNKIDIHELADKIIRLCNNKKIYTKYSNNTNILKLKFDISYSARKYEEVYNELSSNRKRKAQVV